MTSQSGTASTTPAPSSDGSAPLSPERADAAARPLVGRWKTVAASVRGVSHEKSGAACQDSHFVEELPGGILIAAVSDGAGSAEQSEIGAEIAAHTAVANLRRWILSEPAWPETDDDWRPVMAEALEAARLAVEAEAESRSAAPRDLAATLALVLAAPDLVVAAQIGDGAIIIGDDEGLRSLTTPQSGEYLNETTFLVSPAAVEQAETVVWHGHVRTLGAFSDGLQMLALRMSDGTPHPPFFAPLFRFLAEQQDPDEARRQLEAFLASPRITERADDDLTLLLALRWAP